MLVEKVSTAYNNAAALRSAEGSSTGKNGLRLYNSISKDWVNDTRIVEFGTIAIRRDNFSEAELTVDTTDVKNGVAYQRGSVAMKLWESDEEAYIYTAYLTNIPEEYYDDEYLVRTYAKDYKGKIYYGKTVDVSVFEVANAIDNNNSASGEQSDADVAAFNTFVNKSTKTAYAEWCTANGRNTGTLFAQINS